MNFCSCLKNGDYYRIGFNHILQQSWRFEKEHRVSDWHGTTVGKYGCHYTALCVAYVECTFGRGGASDEGHGYIKYIATSVKTKSTNYG